MSEPRTEAQDPAVTGQPPPRAGEARGRIVDTAYELFSRHGIRAVGVDRVIAESGVAKMTLYRHFPSKDALVLEFLRMREQRWTVGWLKAEMDRRGSTPRERLQAMFGAFEDWFARRDFEGCAFLRTVHEIDDPGSPLRQASIAHIGNVRTLVQEQVRQAGYLEPERIAATLHLLLVGAIGARTAGMSDAADEAATLARQLLDTSPTAA